MTKSSPETDSWSAGGSGPVWLDYVIAILLFAWIATFSIGLARTGVRIQALDVEASQGK